MPNVTGFTALANLGNGQESLHTTNNSTSPCEVTGSGMVDGDPVRVEATPSLYWTGSLKIENNKNKCNLRCTNTSTGMGDTDEVTVTVGTSPQFDTTVNVGP